MIYAADPIASLSLFFNYIIMNLVSCSRDLTDHVWNERSLTIALFSLSDKTETFNSPSDTKKPLLTTVLTNYLHTHISKVKTVYVYFFGTMDSLRAKFKVV